MFFKGNPTSCCNSLCLFKVEETFKKIYCAAAMEKISTDIAIIGAGPAGLFTVFEAGMFAGYRCALIDALPEPGGQLSALYPEKPIYDIPGYPTILAGDLVQKLVAQSAPYSPTYLMGASVEKLERSDETGFFHLFTETHEIDAKVIIIAAGGGMFAPRKPPLEGIEAFEKKSVFYAVKNKEKFRGKTLVIAGGGDSAGDWAVELAELAAHIHVVHRRVQFRAAEHTVAAMEKLQKEGRITLHTPYQLAALKGTGGQLEAVSIADLDGHTKDIEADHLLCFFGLLPVAGPLEKWGLKMEEKKIAVDPASMKTSIPGILAIGDIATYAGKMSLILTGFAEAAVAARTAQEIIEPNKKFRLIYSTSKGVPG